MDKLSVRPRKEGEMGRTLKWVDHLLQRSRRELNAQRPEQAVSLLGRLAGATELSDQTRIELFEQLGEAYLMLHDWPRARKSFRAALRIQPQSGRLYQRLARSIASDPALDACRAGRLYRRAVNLSPGDVALLCEAGSFFADMGRWKLSLRYLQQAVDLASEDLGVLATLVDVLCRAERFEEARRAVRVSRFRFRGEHRLDQLQEVIECSASQNRRQTGSDAAGDVIPFLRVMETDDQPARHRRWRRDLASRPRPHSHEQRFFWDHERSG